MCGDFDGNRDFSGSRCSRQGIRIHKKKTSAREETKIEEAPASSLVSLRKSVR